MQLFSRMRTLPSSHLGEHHEDDVRILKHVLYFVVLVLCDI